jgi:hypothetical protein
MRFGSVRDFIRVMLTRLSFVAIALEPGGGGRVVRRRGDAALGGH